jgi:heme a synthase
MNTTQQGSWTTPRRWLHRAAAILAVGTILLIAKGGLVHSAGAGLSVPDWPTTYGQNMFTFPLEQWYGGIFYEHGHRLIASGIGVLTILVAALTWLYDDRRWLKWLTIAALFAVIVQGVLGGLTVLMLLPTSISTGHAMLAQAFLLMTVLIAAATSRSWVNTVPPLRVEADIALQRLLLATVIFTFVQIFLGAVTRHTYSGLAISDFPLNNGRIIPEFTSFGVVIHFLHRVGAVILTAMIVTQGVKILRRRELHRLRKPAIAAMLMVLLQVMLGATVIWTREAIVPNTLHVAGGAITFTIVFLTYAWSRRYYSFSGHGKGSEYHVSEARA